MFFCLATAILQLGQFHRLVVVENGEVGDEEASASCVDVRKAEVAAVVVVLAEASDEESCIAQFFVAVFVASKISDFVVRTSEMGILVQNFLRDVSGRGLVRSAALVVDNPMTKNKNFLHDMFVLIEI